MGEGDGILKVLLCSQDAFGFLCLADRLGKRMDLALQPRNRLVLDGPGQVLVGLVDFSRQIVTNGGKVGI